MNGSSAAGGESLEARLVGSWRSGRRQRIEEIAATPPAVTIGADELWKLVLREIALADELGQRVVADEYVRRFPQFESRIQEAFKTRSSGDEEATRQYVPSDADTATVLAAGVRKSDPESIPAVEQIKEFGDYEILGEIARGGMGVVYRARQKGLNRTVALKMILAGRLASESNVRRFYSEAEAAAGLDHSGIVPIYEVGQRDSQHFFSMAYVDGQSLHDRLKNGPLAPLEAATLLGQVAEAVQFAHSRGIVHRDLKPQNILLDSSGHPKVTDFGLAKRMDGGEGLTQSGDILGTPSYMAPEQAEGKVQEQGPLVDVYALGAVMYAALTGRPPFQAASLMEVLRLVVEQEPVAPRLLNAAIPQDLDTICLKCLHKDPRRRYVSAGDLREDLRNYLDGVPISARPVGSAERLVRWCRRNPVVASLVGLLATLLIVAAVTASAVAVQMRALAKSEGEANRQAQQNEKKERQARLDAEQAEGRATAAKMEAVEARLLTEQQLAESYLNTGRELCDQGQIPAGLLWMTRSLKAVPAGSEVLEQTVRANLGAWLPRMHVLERSIPHPGQCRAVVFHPDGKRFATGGFDGFVRIWNVDGTLIATSARAHDAFIRRLAFSPDGSRIASCADDRKVQFWDVETGKEASRPLQTEHSVTSIAYHRSGETILVATAAGKEGGIRFWNIRDAKPTGPMFETQGPILAVALSRSGRWVVTGTLRADQSQGSGLAQVWNAQTGEKSGSEIRQRFRIVAVDFSPDESLIATGSFDASVRIWDRQTSQPTTPLLNLLGTCQEVRFSPNGHRLLATARDRGYVWDVETAQPIGQLIASPGDNYGADFSPDGLQLLVAGVEPAVGLWKLAGDLHEPVFESVRTHKELASALGFSPDGRWGGADGLIFDVSTRQPIGPPIANKPVYNTKFSPDGRRFATGSGYGQTQVFDVEPRKAIGKPATHRGQIVTAVFSPDGERLGTSSHDGTARLWSVETGEPIGSPMKHPNRVWGAAFQSNGHLFATVCEDNRIRFWDGRSGEPSEPSIELTDRTYEVTFSPDGRRIAAGSFENLVQFWDVETRREVGTPLQHASPVTRIAYSADGNLMATAAFDGGVRLWDLRNGQRIGPVGQYDGQVIGLALRGDASMLLAATEHGHSRLQMLPPAATSPADQIERTVNVAAREELTSSNAVRPLKLDQWRARRDAFATR